MKQDETININGIGCAEKTDNYKKEEQMREYHKIQTVYKRNPETKFKTLLENEFTVPEFQYLKDNQWVFTEKVDGTNIRIMWDGNTLTIGGRTDNAQINVQLMEILYKIFPVDKFKTFDNPITLYGEGYGPKINKGGCYSLEHNFVLFDVMIFSSNGRYWLRRDSVKEIANMMNIDVVPIIGNGTITDMVEKTKKGFQSMWGDFTAEGIVARPMIELMTRTGHRIITKIKYKDFKKI